jgi:hypothetical protein
LAAALPSISEKPEENEEGGEEDDSPPSPPLLAFGSPNLGNSRNEYKTNLE